MEHSFDHRWDCLSCTFVKLFLSNFRFLQKKLELTKRRMFRVMLSIVAAVRRTVVGALGNFVAAHQVVVEAAVGDIAVEVVVAGNFAEAAVGDTAVGAVDNFVGVVDNFVGMVDNFVAAHHIAVGRILAELVGMNEVMIGQAL